MKTLVAVPCMDMMHTQFVSSLMSIRAKEGYEFEFGASSLVYDTRNQFIAKAIDGGFDRILWSDSDMVFTAADVAYLEQDMDHGYDFVCGLAFNRKPPFTPVIFSECFIDKNEAGQLIPTSTVMKDYPKDALFEVAAFGFGFVMMSVEGLKRIVDRYGRMLFMPHPGFGEDLSFCLRAHSAGEHLFCDSRTEIGHVGTYVYGKEQFERYEYA